MIADGWVDWAIRVPGARQDKVYTRLNRGLGIVWHSQEGNNLGPVVNIQNSSRPTSYMFWLAKNGDLHQFVPVTGSAWTSGNFEANTRYWPVELEGFYNEPINDLQLYTALRLMDEWEVYSGLQATRPGTMWEHREVDVIATPNAGETACPSERYARLWVALNEGADMGDIERLNRELEQVRLIAEKALAIAEATNAGVVRRFTIIETASGPYDTVVAAFEALQDADLLERE